MDNSNCWFSPVWPLHPQPYKNETLYSWTKRLAAAYDISHAAFCRHVLGMSVQGICRLWYALPDEALAILATGTGVPIYRLREMAIGAIIERSQKNLEQYMWCHEPAFTTWLVALPLRREEALRNAVASWLYPASLSSLEMWHAEFENLLARKR